jgi:hypothetical protein
MLKTGNGSVRVSENSDNDSLISISQLLLVIRFSFRILTFCITCNTDMQVQPYHLQKLDYMKRG